MSTSFVCQQIVALDAKYKNYRCKNNEHFRTAYLRRRMQILRDYSANNIADFHVRKDYLRLRKQIISRMFGQMSEASSMFGSSIQSSRLRLDTVGISSEDRCAVEPNKKMNVVPTENAAASRSLVGGTSVAENYAFRGMHHIFDEHAGSTATTVKFANNEKNMFAYSSMSGSLFVCEITPVPKVLHRLDKHDGGVSDFSWSLSNDLIVSVGHDSCLKLWQVNNGKVLRVIQSNKLGMVKCPLYCCLFQPLNNNMALCGNSCGQITVANISTGKLVKGGSARVSGAVLSMSFDSSGRILWAGTDNGYVISFTFDFLTGRITKQYEMCIDKLKMVSSIKSRSWVSREARDPSLLINTSNNKLQLFKVTDGKGMLKLRRRFDVRHSKRIIKSVFCPIMSFRKGACVVSGGEDSNITFFDVMHKGENCVVNTLQGHSSPVVDVCFNCDESFLVSCDTQGSVFVWKRV